MATIDRGGVSIFYEVRGDGPPILLSHGYSATSQMWRGQVEVLSKSYRLITWDMRGHGESDSPADSAAYSEAATVGDMAAILAACGIRRAVIAGLSLGGYMSLAFHLSHPEMTRALMLFDTGPGYRNPKGREGWNETALARARAFEERGLDALGGSAEVRVSRHRSAAGLALSARGMLAQVDSRVIESLESIAVPNPRARGREGPAVHRCGRVHGGKDPRRRQGCHSRRGPRGEYRPAGCLQRGGRGVSRLPACRLTPEFRGRCHSPAPGNRSAC